MNTVFAERATPASTKFSGDSRGMPPPPRRAKAKELKVPGFPLPATIMPKAPATANSTKPTCVPETYAWLLFR